MEGIDYVVRLFWLGMHIMYYRHDPLPLRNFRV